MLLSWSAYTGFPPEQEWLSSSHPHSKDARCSNKVSSTGFTTLFSFLDCQPLLNRFFRMLSRRETRLATFYITFIGARPAAEGLFIRKNIVSLLNFKDSRVSTGLFRALLLGLPGRVPPTQFELDLFSTKELNPCSWASASAAMPIS